MPNAAEPGVESRASSEGGVLAGLRVLEIGGRIATPLAGMFLAEHGAEVVRLIDPADSEKTGDSILAAMLARGKTEASLDCRAPEGRASLRRLLLQADVVLGAEALGGMTDVAPETIRREGNPGLVSATVSSFPDGDPRAELPDHEALAAAAGFIYQKPIGKPVFHEMLLGSVISGIMAANGVIAALFARLETGRGQHVATDLFSSNLFTQMLSIFIKSGVPRGFLPLKMVATPFMSSWRCADGRYVYLHITLPAHNLRMMELLSANGYEEKFNELQKILSPETVRDPSQVGSISEAKKIRRFYEGIFLSRTADEWEELLGRELCCIKIRTIDEWVTDSQAAGMSDARTVDDPIFGPLTVPGASGSSSTLPPIVRARTVAAEGELAAVLARWSADPRPTEIDPRAPVPNHPLSGVRVFDMSRIIAGPCAARALAELGADVLSVQSENNLDWALSFHLLFNAGKRSVTLDMNSEEGKRTLWAIMDDFQPDVFVQNYRNLELAEEIGVHPEAVRQRFPETVYLHLNAYGNEGDWKVRPGFEQVVQAVSGIQMSYGGGERPKLMPTPAIDIGTGLLGAFNALLGLYHRRRTGEGSFVATHLTRVSVLFQLESIAATQRGRCLAATSGSSPEAEREKRIAAGLVRIRGGRACLAGRYGDLVRWARSEGLLKRLTGGEPPPNKLIAALEPGLRRRRLLDLEQALGARSADAVGGIVRLPRIGELFEPGPNGAAPLIKRDYAGSPKQLAFVPAPLSLSLTPVCLIEPPPLRGTHTREVLARVGVEVSDGAGVVPYPPDKPLIPWLIGVIRWGYFAWRSGVV